MNIYIANNNDIAAAILDHTNLKVVLDEETHAVFVPNPLTEVPENLVPINTCLAVRHLLQEPEKSRTLFEGLVTFSGPFPAVLFGFFNGTEISPLVEMSFSSRFLSGNLGPNLTDIQKAAAFVAEDAFSAFPTLIDIINILAKLEYRGMVYFGINDSFEIVSINYGYVPTALALYKQLCILSTEELIRSTLGEIPFDSFRMNKTAVALSLTLTNPPYPYPIENVQRIQHIKIPEKTKRHIWRNYQLGHDVINIAARAPNIAEARGKLRWTTSAFEELNENIQFRIDGGRGEKFVLEKEKYETASHVRISSSPKVDSPV